MDDHLLAGVFSPPRDSDAQKPFLGPKKYSLWRFPIEIFFGPR
jgi:hypothetical protein